MIFDFFAVIRKPDIDVVLCVQDERGSCCKWNALVCWAEENVEFREGIGRGGERVDYCLCIGACDNGEDWAGREQASVDEVRRNSESDVTALKNLGD